MNEVRSQGLDCPACGPAEFRRRFQKKGRAFWRCSQCGLEKIHPLPTQDELAAYYDREYRDGMYKTFTTASTMKELTATHRLKQIRGRVPRGKWLDVGCSDGVFVSKAAEVDGVDAQGVELSQVAVDLAVQDGLHVSCGTLDDVDERNFDCITAFDVLEHVIDPLQFLHDIELRLSAGGCVAITVPNVGSVIRRLMGSRWYFYIPEEHLHYFKPAVIRKLLSRVGLQVMSCQMAFKPLTYNYAMTQFVEYNPLIYRVLHTTAYVLPNRVREWIVPLYIGEMMVIARKPEK